MEPSTLTTRPTPPAQWRGGGDGRLARQAARGDEQAFAAIFSRHHEALFRYCRSIVGNEHDATDALQSTMVKALEKLPGETRRIALRPWLFRIAHNESIDLLRSRRPHADLDAAVDVSDRVSSTELETRQRLHALEADLQRLTQQQRSSLLLRELVGLSFAEAAEALGITPAAAKQSVYEARQALHAREEGRAMDCDALCRALSDGDRRTLRGKAVRAHLDSCPGCRAFEAALRRRPADLGLLAPLPAAGGLGGLGVLGASAAGTAGVGAGAAAGGGFLGGVLPALTASVGTKVAVALTVGAVAAGGVAVVEQGGDGVGDGPDAADAANGQAAATGPTASGPASAVGSSGGRDARGVAGGTSAGLQSASLERPAAGSRGPVGAGATAADGAPDAAGTPNAHTPADGSRSADAPAAQPGGGNAGAAASDADDRSGGKGAPKADDAGGSKAAKDDEAKDARSDGSKAEDRREGSEDDEPKAGKPKAPKADKPKAPKADAPNADAAPADRPDVTRPAGDGAKPGASGAAGSGSQGDAPGGGSGPSSAGGSSGAPGASGPTPSAAGAGGGNGSANGDGAGNAKGGGNGNGKPRATEPPAGDV